MYRNLRGKKFTPHTPDPKSIDIKDIGMFLAKTDVFRGQEKIFYSLAQFSMLISKAFENDKEKQMMAMFYFAPELYMGYQYANQKSPKYYNLYREWYEIICIEFIFKTKEGMWDETELKQYAKINCEIVASQIRSYISIMYKQAKQTIGIDANAGTFKKLIMFFKGHSMLKNSVYPSDVAFESFMHKIINKNGPLNLD